VELAALVVVFRVLYKQEATLEMPSLLHRPRLLHGLRVKSLSVFACVKNILVIFESSFKEEA
jgi:hypothetical protein